MKKNLLLLIFCLYYWISQNFIATINDTLLIKVMWYVNIMICASCLYISYAFYKFTLVRIFVACAFIDIVSVHVMLTNFIIFLISEIIIEAIISKNLSSVKIWLFSFLYLVLYLIACKL